MQTGRPSDFRAEVANEICDRLAKGESLRSICHDARDDFIPHRATIIRWLGENEEFRDQYARAREAQADHYAEEIVAIADCTDVQANPFDGAVPVVRDPQRDRLRIDARKWVASKLAPKRYGDKVALTGGDEGDAPLQVIINKPA